MPANGKNSSSLIQAYARLPVSFDRGEGVRLWDQQGNEYFDAIGGIAVCGLGHSHPAIAKTISEQAGTLLHTSNLYSITHQENLANKLCELTGMDAVFFANSGAEANEAAIKLSRLQAHKKQIEQPVVITFDGSFHGRTMATLSATGNKKVHNGFAPLMSEFLHLPYNDISAIEAVADNKNIVAVLVEPILGEGGIVVPDDGYLAAIRSICDRYDWLMMCDEIQTGVGRTGNWYASIGQGVMPDVFATRVALSVIETMQQENTPANALRSGARLKEKLNEALHNRAQVKEIRGQGMMIGVELEGDCAGLVNTGLNNKVLFNVTAGNVVRLLPPCNLTESEVDEIARRVSDSIITHCQTTSGAMAV